MGGTDVADSVSLEHFDLFVFLRGYFMGVELLTGGLGLLRVPSESWEY